MWALREAAPRRRGRAMLRATFECPAANSRCSSRAAWSSRDARAWYKCSFYALSLTARCNTVPVVLLKWPVLFCFDNPARIESALRERSFDGCPAFVKAASNAQRRVLLPLKNPCFALAVCVFSVSAPP